MQNVVMESTLVLHKMEMDYIGAYVFVRSLFVGAFTNSASGRIKPLL